MIRSLLVDKDSNRVTHVLDLGELYESKDPQTRVVQGDPAYTFDFGMYVYTLEGALLFAEPLK